MEGDRGDSLQKQKFLNDVIRWSDFIIQIFLPCPYLILGQLNIYTYPYSFQPYTVKDHPCIFLV